MNADYWIRWIRNHRSPEQNARWRRSDDFPVSG